MTFDDVSFTTNIAISDGDDVITPYRCVALVDTGFSQSMTIAIVSNRNIGVSAASVRYERPCSRRSSRIVFFGLTTPRRPAHDPAAVVQREVLGNMSV